MNAPRRTRHRQGFGLPEILLALASLVLFLGGAELAARLFDLRPASGTALANPPWLGGRWMLRKDYRDEMASEGLLSRYYELYEWDRYLFYRLRPDTQLELLDVMAPPSLRERTRWSVHTNHRGFRTDDFAEHAAPGVVRIAVLGDSSTFGWGVEQFEAYPEILRDVLARRWRVPRERLEVLNLGVPGYSSFQGRVMLERVALPLEPDLVVWSYLSNDGTATGEGDEAAYARRAGPVGALLAVLHASRAFEALESWIAVFRARLHPPRPPDPYDSAQRNIPSYRAARTNVEASVAVSRAAGVPIVLLGQCIRSTPAMVMRKVAEARHVPHLDGTALLDAEIPAIATEPRYAAARKRFVEHWGAATLAENPYWLAFLPDGCHPNSLGHRLVAEALADTIVQAFPEPPR